MFLNIMYRYTSVLTPIGRYSLAKTNLYINKYKSYLPYGKYMIVACIKSNWSDKKFHAWICINMYKYTWHA